MLLIECDTCEREFLVKGHTTPDSWTDPGEVVTDLECDTELCSCLMEGSSFTVVEETHDTFDDDVL